MLTRDLQKEIADLAAKKIDSDIAVLEAAQVSRQRGYAPEFDNPIITELIKDAIPSPNGLYPHEVLALNYAHRYCTYDTTFHISWLYDYGIKDMGVVFSSLLERGFLQLGGIESSLNMATVDLLKDILADSKLKVSGKKVELIKRLIDNIPPEILSEKYKKRVYQLTELGKEELKRESYVIFAHEHPSRYFNIWDLNKVVYTEPLGDNPMKIAFYLCSLLQEYASREAIYECEYIIPALYDYLSEIEKTEQSSHRLKKIERFKNEIDVIISNLRENSPSIVMPNINEVKNDNAMLSENNDKVYNNSSISYISEYEGMDKEEIREEMNDNNFMKMNDNYKKAKQRKDYERVIYTGNAIIKLASQAKSIGIATYLFQKGVADAYLKLDQIDKAIVYYRAVLSKYKKDYEKIGGEIPPREIASLEQKIARLEEKLK